MFSNKGSSQPQWNNNQTTDSMDIFCDKSPEDTITTIRFSNVTNWDNDPQFISCSSWDNTVKVWEIQSSYNSCNAAYQGEFNFDAPVLGHCWAPDNSVIFGAGADNCVKVWDLKSNSCTKVGEHSNCVKDVYFNEANNILMSAGWDGRLRFWDMKQQGP